MRILFRRILRLENTMVGVLGSFIQNIAIFALITIINSIEVIDMIRNATAMTVRNNLGELLNEVTYRHDSIVIQKSGKPVAAIVDIALFEKIRLMQDEFDALCSKLADKVKDEEADMLNEDLVEAVKAARLSA